MVHLFPHWTWSDKKGTVIPVWCYTNCWNVELFLTAKSAGLRVGTVKLRSVLHEKSGK
ncbi:MAG: DUF4982 domain-containing protein [Kiritimatiellia bacterium]|nr:DUF4982 domain-containing protein [Kiritimatiellia bacterium]MDP6848024.1 DUF4982 domain-containing protein [Kiritimatiellia bacterium]